MGQPAADRLEDAAELHLSTDSRGQKRCEEEVVTRADDRYVESLLGQARNQRVAGKTAAEHHDALSPDSVFAHEMTVSQATDASGGLASHRDRTT